MIKPICDNIRFFNRSTRQTFFLDTTQNNQQDHPLSEFLFSVSLNQSSKVTTPFPYCLIILQPRRRFPRRVRRYCDLHPFTSLLLGQRDNFTAIKLPPQVSEKLTRLFPVQIVKNRAADGGILIHNLAKEPGGFRVILAAVDNYFHIQSLFLVCTTISCVCNITRGATSCRVVYVLDFFCSVAVLLRYLYYTRYSGVFGYFTRCIVMQRISMQI